MHVCLHVCVYVYMCGCLCHVRVCVSVCVLAPESVCVCAHAYIHKYVLCIIYDQFLLLLYAHN